MDVLVVVKKQGFSGLRELVEHLLQNLNFRSWNINDFTAYGLILGYHGSNIIKVDSAVPNTEIEKYLQVFFNLSSNDSKEVLDTLIELGFLKKSYCDTEWSPRWVNHAKWSYLVSSNLR